MALGGGQDAAVCLGERVSVVVERLAHAHDSAGLAQRGQGAGVEL
jgi:hypothetical protein